MKSILDLDSLKTSFNTIC